MINYIFTICLFLTTNFLSAQNPGGIWNTGNENTKIEISESSGVYQGKIKSSDNPEAKIGAIIIKDIKSVDGNWTGKLYAAKKGEWVDVELEPTDDKLIITVNVGFISKKIEWFQE